MSTPRRYPARIGNRFNSGGALAEPRPETRAVTGEELWWPPGGSAGVVVTEQTALQSATLLATVSVIATDISIFPLKITQTMPDGTCREATEHGNHEIVSRTPDGDSTPAQWRQSQMLHALIYGNGYAEIQRLGSGNPYKLHLLEPRMTTAKRDAAKNLYYETSSSVVGQTKIPASNVLHIAGLGYDGISGYNMVRLMRQAIGLSMAGETFAADFFSNGSESGGSIEIPGRLEDDEAVQRLRNRWEGRHQGAGRRHRVAILEEGAKYTATSTDPEKSQLLETRKFQVLDTARPWRVPPHKIGDYSQSHLANIEASNLDYLMTALMGWLVTIEQQYDLKLFTRKEWLDGYRFEHDFSALLRGDLVSRFNAYKAAIQDGWMSRNEVRKREKLNPIPDKSGSPGDMFTVQMQVVELGTKPPPPPPPVAPVKPVADEPEPKVEADTETPADETKKEDQK